MFFSHVTIPLEEEESIVRLESLMTYEEDVIWWHCCAARSMGLCLFELLVHPSILILQPPGSQPAMSDCSQHTADIHTTYALTHWLTAHSWPPPPLLCFLQCSAVYMTRIGSWISNSESKCCSRWSCAHALSLCHWRPWATLWVLFVSGVWES